MMGDKKLAPPHPQIPFLLYGDANDQTRIKVLMREETIWLTLTQIAELFGVQKPAISKHLQNIYETHELEPESTISKLETVQVEGTRQVKRILEIYNLDAIIAVGYRVNSKRATQFRIWATKTLKEYIKKGFVLDDDRLKQGEKLFEHDHFQELLERIRSIRASERRIYQQITDIFAECCTDYDSRSEITHNFYAMIQNKFHFAITGKTAAEIIHSKANNKDPAMGLLSWKNSPKGRILSSDVTVAKNYLQEKEIKKLERTISSFFDYIESLIERHFHLTMSDMVNSVDKFLNFNEYQILDGKGNISKAQADKKALKEYEIFNKTQGVESDFDKILEQTERPEYEDKLKQLEQEVKEHRKLKKT